MVHEIYYNPCPPNGGILCTASESYDHILYPHYHSVYELTIVVSGIHRLELENETLLLGAGDLVLLRPNETHARCLESPGKYITLAFPAGEFREVMKFLGSGASMRMFWQKHPPRTLLCRTEVDMIIPRIEYLNLLCASRPESTRMELRALLVMLLDPGTETQIG